MKNKLILFLLFLSATSSGQVLFKRTYGLGSINEGLAVIQTSDNGFAVTGSTTPYLGGQTDAYLLKTDSFGNAEYQFSFGGVGIDHATSLVQLSDSGFLLAGYTNTAVQNNDYDVYLVRTDKLGNLIWAKTIGTNNWDFIYDMKPSPDGNFILAGNSYGSGNGSSAGLIIKIDESGNVIWQKFVEQNSLVHLNKLAIQSNGNFVACGNVSQTIAHPNDGFVAFFNSTGDTIRTAAVDSGKFENFNAIGFYSNGDIGLAGLSIDSTLSDNKDEVIMRMDSLANIIWYFAFQSAGQDENNDLYIHMDTLITAGSTSSNGQGNADFHIVKFNPSGWFAGGATFGGTQYDYCNQIKRTSDGGFVLVGSSTSYGPGQQSILLIKSDSLFSFLSVSNVTIGIAEFFKKNNLTCFPNPSSGTFTVESNSTNEVSVFSIFSISGRKLYSKMIQNFPVTVETNLIPGIYLIEIKSERSIRSEKIIVTGN